ncbi:hypothetical protein A2U01_0075985, partial [Trifolium medium]|nr:hypothetical protein [Trifolium medium]
MLNGDEGVLNTVLFAELDNQLARKLFSIVGDYAL